LRRLFCIIALQTSMENKLEHYKLWSFTAFSCLFFVALIGSEKAPALLSIVMAGQILSVILLTHPKTLFLNFLHDKGSLFFSFSYLFLLISLFYSENFDYLFQRLQIKLPLLLYAIVWANVGRFSQTQLKLIIYSLAVTVGLTCVGILINYFMHFKEINQSYLESKIMPGPINHIRFSLLVVTTLYLIYYFLAHYRCLLQEKAQRILIMTAVFFVIFLHIYSVRSGLLALYVMLFVCLANYVVRSKNIKNGALAFLLIAVICGTSFILSPTLRNKLLNTKQDVNVYQNNQDPNYNSLSTRMVSYEIAFEILKENIWWGCGQGDLEDKNNALFKVSYPTIVVPIIPHNQFVYYLAATGIIGCLIFLVCFTAPFWIGQFYKLEIMQVSYITLLMAFQFEAMLETQVGVACTVIIIFFPYYLAKTRKLMGQEKL
jgi:O-antigen ligase